MVQPNRKPHLLRVKQQIVALLDAKISEIISLEGDEREIAIWIRQRNKIAKDADVSEIPLNNKDGTGKIVYSI